jgi:hypothetical protein
MNIDNINKYKKNVEKAYKNTRNIQIHLDINIDI